MAKFKPARKVLHTTYTRLVFDVGPEIHDRVAEAASKLNLSKSAFVREAVVYALDNMEGE